MKKILGLDLGTTSIGWALVNEAENPDEQSSIEKIGVRVNPLTTDEKNNFEKGKSITTNAERSMKKGMRRNLQRFKQRRTNLTACLIRNGFITADEILSETGNQSLFETYRLRAKAVHEKISLSEFARVLLMINKKRGYKSNRKANDTEDGQAFDGISVAKVLYENGLTPGQYALQLLEDGKKYLPDFYKSDLEDELSRILSFQQQYYPDILTSEFIRSLMGKEKGSVRNLFKSIGIVSSDIKAKDKRISYLRLRVTALKSQIELSDLAAVVEQLSGIINSSSKLLGSISDRSKELFFQNITVGEYIIQALDNNPNFSIKNKTFFRKDYLDEFNRIWDTQSVFYPALSQELRKKISGIIFFQRPLKSKKGLVGVCELDKREIEVCKDGKIKKKIIGPKVCPKSSPIFQEFKIWQKLNDTVVFDSTTNSKVFLTQAQKELLAEELNIKEKLRKSEIIKILFGKDKTKDLNFEEIQGNTTSAAFYKAYERIMEMSGHDQGFAKLTGKQTYDFVSSVFNALQFNTSILDFDATADKKGIERQPSYQIWHLLYSYEGDKSATGNQSLIKKINELYHFDNEDYAKEIAKIFFKPDYGNLSAKAICKILPFLKEGMCYSEACAKAGYNHSSKSLTKEEIANKELADRLEPLSKNSLRNPVVEKILNQMINVINSVVATYGKIDEIRLEMARDLKKTAKEREEMSQSLNKTKQEHDSIADKLKKDFGFGYVSRNDIIRYKLYMELKDNGFKTLYSNTYIPYDKLFTDSFDIEHIIPKAKLFDDSFANKTLEAREANIRKGNQTAYDFVADTYPDRLEDYQNIVADLFGKHAIGKRKKNYLLMKEQDIPTDFLNRDLSDTRYITKKAMEILGQIVPVVTTTTGSVTDRLREHWQLIDLMKELNFPKYKMAGLTELFQDHHGRPVQKIMDWTKRNDHRHHALDALTIAFTKPSFIQYFNNLSARGDKSSVIYAIEKKEMERLPDGKLVFKAPMDRFRQEAKLHLEGVLVSVKSKSKVTTKSKNKPRRKDDSTFVQTTLTPRGALHNETIYGKRKQYLVKPEKVGASFDAQKIGCVAKKIYRDALLQRLMAFGGDAKKAFTGKNSLEKNPVWLDSNHTYAVPARVEVVEVADIYTIRKPVTKDLRLDKVLDVGIRRILEERLQECGGDAAKAFSNLDENPIWLNREKGISIKRVTLNAGLSGPEALRVKRDKDGNTMTDENGCQIPSDYVQTAGNHHVAIFEDEDGKLQEHMVSFYEATARSIQGLPVVDRHYNHDLNWKFMFTMKQNEYFVFPSGDFRPDIIDLKSPANFEIVSKHLYRVQKLSSKDYYFRHHLETTVEENKALKDHTWLRITNIEKLRGIVKVRVDNLGRIVETGEY